MAATAIWCAAGRITIAHPESASVRLAVPAPLWVWLAALAAAFIVRRWRTRPAFASPALLATVPWWPVPLPAAALIWTGPLAWVPIGLAFIAGVWPVPIDPARRADVVGDAGSPTWSPIVCGVTTAIVLGLTAWALAPRLPGGDEPHYLIITQSLLKDGDLQIENNHRARDYAAYFGDDLRPDFLVRGRNGAIYSIHAPGVSALVAPAFALAGYRGAQATVILCAALASALIWIAAWRATHRRDAAWFAWAASTGAITFLIQGVTIFPDGPAMLAVAFATWLLVRLELEPDLVSPSVLFAGGAALAALPWLHSRFVVISFGLGVAITWRLWSRRTSAARRTVAFLLLPAIAGIAWITYFQILYGSPSPAAAYGPDTNHERQFQYVPGGVTALMFDQQFGLIFYAPALAAVVMGWLVRASDRAAGTARALAATTLAYLAAVGMYWMFWAGVPAPPARFAAAALPMLALPAAMGYAKAGSIGRAVWQMLLLVTLATSAILVGYHHGELAWNTRGIQAAWLAFLGPVVDLARAWPSFFWLLEPKHVASEWPFFEHVAIALGAIATLGLVVAAYSVRAPTIRRTPAIVAAWVVPLAVMIVSMLGWALTMSSGLAAATSQLQVAAAIGAGRDVWRVAPMSVARIPAATASAASLVTIAVTAAPNGDGPGVWARWSPVPAGTFQLTVVSRRPMSGTLSLRVGRSLLPLTSVTLASVSRQTTTVALPAGAEVLSIEADAALAAAGGEVTLTPVQLAPTPAFARASLTRPAGVIFFLDDRVFVEADGFWIRGRAGTSVALAAASGPAALVLTNGGAPNQVTLLVAGSSELVLTMAPGETREVPLAPGVASGARVDITSAAGFRPSDGGASNDARFLGVFVRLR